MAAPASQPETCSVTVAVRCRPFNEREILMQSQKCIIFEPDGKTLKIYPSGAAATAAVTGNQKDPGATAHTFTFDHSYDENIPQQQLFDDIGSRVLTAGFCGFNTCIFAYGQTGSGKSYAMMGPAGGRDATKDPGLIPRICTRLFADIERLEAENKADVEAKKGFDLNDQPPKLSHEVDVTYLEIYQEHVKCLLNPSKENLKVRQHPTLGVFVEDLTQITVTSYDKVFELIEGGNNVRHVASTNMNERSSRSHAIFTLILTQRRIFQTKIGERVSERKSRINLVDLAGSERAKSTGAEGDTLREGSNINKSLTILGLVISGLAEASKAGPKKPFIPYRDSQLTWLLKENLGGNSKTFMLSTLSPADVNYEETLSTLRYADRAKAIVTKAFVNEDPTAKLIRELREQLELYRTKLEESEREKERLRRPVGVPTLNLAKVAMPMPKASVAMAAKGPLRVPGQQRGMACTPRTAIEQVTYVENGSDEEPMDDDLEAPDMDKMRDIAELNEKLLMKLDVTEDERRRQQEQEIAARDEAMKKVEVTIKARSEPYLLNVDGVGDWVMEYLTEDVTYIGSAKVADTTGCRHCQIEADGVMPKHCCLIKQPNGTFVLRPFEDAPTFLDEEEQQIQSDTVVQSGQIIYLGEQTSVKFVDPGAAPATSRRSMRFRRLTMTSGNPSPTTSYSPERSPVCPMTPPLAGEPPMHERNTTPPQLAPKEVPKVIPETQHEDHQDPQAAPPQHSHGAVPLVPRLNLVRPRASSVTVGSGGGTTTSENSTIPEVSTLHNLPQQRPVAVVRTPRITTSTFTALPADEVVCAHRQMVVLLGSHGSGKSALRDSMLNPLKWYQSKHAPSTPATFGFDICQINEGSMTKADLVLLELSGLDCFSVLQSILPEERVVYVICFRLNECCDVQYFRKYLELIQCRSPTSTTSIVLVGTFSDQVRHDTIEPLVTDAQSIVQTYLAMLEPNERLRARVIMSFAVSNYDRTVITAVPKVQKVPQLLTWLADLVVQSSRHDTEYIHGMIPVRVMTLARKVMEMKAKGMWIVPSQEYKRAAWAVDPRYEKNVDELHRHTQLLHGWGMLQHFHRHIFLKKFVIVDVRFATRILSAVACCMPTEADVISFPSDGAETAPNEDSIHKSSMRYIASMLAKSGGTAPFSIEDVLRADINQCLSRGFLTSAVASELFRVPMKEKQMAAKDMTLVLEYLEKCDILMKGSKLQVSMTHVRSRPSRSASTTNESVSKSMLNDSLGNPPNQGAPSRIAAAIASVQNLYLVPACFVTQVPSIVTVHLDPLLYGPTFRFALNVVPPFFFPRLVCRISCFAHRVYLGPFHGVTPTEGVEHCSGLWSHCAWVISSDVARCLIRLVQRSLFVTFHDQGDDEFHNGLCETIRSLVAESPGIHCEETRRLKLGDDSNWEPLRRDKADSLSGDSTGTRSPIDPASATTDTDVTEDKFPNKEKSPAFVAAEVLEAILNNNFIGAEVKRRLEVALKQIQLGRRMEDKKEGARIEGNGMDELVDILAQTQA